MGPKQLQRRNAVRGLFLACSGGTQHPGSLAETTDNHSDDDDARSRDDDDSGPSDNENRPNDGNTHSNTATNHLLSSTYDSQSDEDDGDYQPGSDDGSAPAGAGASRSLRVIAREGREPRARTKQPSQWPSPEKIPFSNPSSIPNFGHSNRESPFTSRRHTTTCYPTSLKTRGRGTDRRCSFTPTFRQEDVQHVHGFSNLHAVGWSRIIPVPD